MKSRNFLIILCVLTFVSSAFSQAKQISANEFIAANSKAYELMTERSYRMVYKTDTFEDGKIISSVTKTDERLPPDKLRFFSVEKVGDKETTFELIVIGKTEYRRENGGQWTATELRGYGGGSGTTRSSISCFQYTEESYFIDGVSSRKLRRLAIEKTDEGLSFDDFIYWFDAQGFYLRSERTKGLLDPKVTKTHSVVTYEYDLNIKIETPVIKEKQK